MMKERQDKVEVLRQYVKRQLKPKGMISISLILPNLNKEDEEELGKDLKVSRQPVGYIKFATK